MALLFWTPSPRTLCFLPTFVLLFQRAAIMGQLSLNAERVPLAKLALTPVLAQTPSGNGRDNGPGPGLGPWSSRSPWPDTENFVCAGPV